MASGRFSQRYAFTVTLKPSQFNKNAEDQYDDCIKDIESKLTSVCAHVTVVAELTKNCNIHFHGIADFDLNHPNLIKKFHDHFRCRCLNKYKCKCKFGFVNIKQMDNENGWVEYIRKDLKTTYEAIARRPIIKDDFNIFPLSIFELYGFSIL